MATISSSRFRPSDAQALALAAVQPELRARDQTWRRKYLRDFTGAFRTYEAVIDSSQFDSLLSPASMVLIGDYHALPACQHFTANLVKDAAQKKDRPVVLAVETVFSRDQHILDEWWGGGISEQELRRRMRFDLDWGYDWQPFYELLSKTRKHAVGVFGLDCMPREDLRKIGIRDRHAAHKLTEIRKRYPQAAIIVLVGESHLAPSHLPALLDKQLPEENALSVLLNVDALYWQASQEEMDVQAVRVTANTVCVFNSTPLEKYASYQSCLNRWRQERFPNVDFAPAVYELINRLLKFLGIDRPSLKSGVPPQFLVDLLPEVCGPSIDQTRELLSRQNLSDKETREIFLRLDDRGCLYLPQCNLFIVRELRIPFATEEAARFVHHACQSLSVQTNPIALSAEDLVHTAVVEQALVHLGSEILCRAHEKKDQLDESPGLHAAFLRGDLSRADIKRLFLFSVREPGKAAGLCAHLNKRLGLTL